MPHPTTTIEIPRLDGESNRAYAARVEYITMGAGRSIEKAAQNNTKTIPHYKAWSSKYNWVEHARRYDDAQAHLAAVAATEEYQEALRTQRADAMKIGGELITLGRTLAAEVIQRRNSMEYKPSDLATAVKAILAGMDMRAHALDVARLLPNIEGAEVGDD